MRLSVLRKVLLPQPEGPMRAVMLVRGYLVWRCPSARGCRRSRGSAPFALYYGALLGADQGLVHIRCSPCTQRFLELLARELRGEVDGEGDDQQHDRHREGARRSPRAPSRRRRGTTVRVAPEPRRRGSRRTRPSVSPPQLARRMPMPAVNMSTALSPTMRPTARMQPVTMPSTQRGQDHGADHVPLAAPQGERPLAVALRHGLERSPASCG